MDNDLEPVLLRKTRLLTQALIISGTLNIALLCTFFYFTLQEEKVSYNFENSTSQMGVKNAALSHQEVLKAYSSLPFDELILRLENKEHVEEGLSKRDLALAALGSVHHLDVEKALGGTPFEKRMLLYKGSEGAEPQAIPVFLGLADYQYQAIINFAKTEKWPLTPKGLFFHLKLSTAPKDSSLLDAFYLTSLFDNIYNLFSRSSLEVKKEKLVDIICSCDWNIIEPYAKLADFSEEARRKFLITYANYGSKDAATLLIDTDAEFVAKRIEDAYLCKLLDLYEGGQKSLEPIAKEVLKSFRSDNTRKKAATILYSLSNEVMPEPFDITLAMKRFFPDYFSQAKKEMETKAEPQTKLEIVQVVPKKTEPVALKKTEEKKQAKASPQRTHTVQDGDSLWKIAKRYKVDVEAIKKANNMDTEKLKPGKKLIIPDSKKSL